MCVCVGRKMFRHVFSRTRNYFRYHPTLSQVAGYKSIYNLDYLYPKNNLSSINSSAKLKIQDEDSSDKFSGHVPIDQLSIQYSRASGAGGQHINKINTKVEIRFHVESASWIPESAKPKLLEQQRNSITKDGYLRVTSEKTRRQMLNQADCLEKIRSMVREAAKKPPQPKPEELEVIAARKAKARKLMVEKKRLHSLKKQARQF